MTGWDDRRRMNRRAPTLVVSAYVVFGAYAVHALRYAIAPGAQPDGAHGYLHLAPLVLASLLPVVMARLCLVLVDRRATSGRRLSWHARWIFGALGFAGLYAAQENVELLAATGHVAGALPLLADGGWIVLPAVVVAGGLLAALLRGTEAALDRLTMALNRPRPRPHAGCSVRPLLPRAAHTPKVAQLARHAAERAPPLTA